MTFYTYWHQAITYTNINISKVSSGIHLKVISQEVLMNICSWITF